MSYEVFTGVVKSYEGQLAVHIEGMPTFPVEGLTLDQRVVGLHNNQDIAAVRPAKFRGKEYQHLTQVNPKLPQDQVTTCVRQLSEAYCITDLGLSTVFGPRN